MKSQGQTSPWGRHIKLVVTSKTSSTARAIDMCLWSDFESAWLVGPLVTHIDDALLVFIRHDDVVPIEEHARRNRIEDSQFMDTNVLGKLDASFEFTRIKCLFVRMWKNLRADLLRGTFGTLNGFFEKPGILAVFVVLIWFGNYRGKS